MSIADACETIRQTIRPEFHGQITINVKDGGIATLEVRQIFKERPMLKNSA